MSCYGLAPFKTRPLSLTTSDGETIGAWHILPEVYYQQHSGSSSNPEWDDVVYLRSMQLHPTIIYLHGNSMNRAAPFRIAAYQSLTSRIDANIVAIDYRGFGDSTGVPSEEGLVEDAETAYRWIRQQQGPSSQKITVFGQSLGTGIGALLAAKLEKQSTPLDGLVLMAPYTSLKALVKDFRIGGILPLLKPISLIPFNENILDTFLKTHLNTLHTLPKLTSSSFTSTQQTSIVLLHAHDDPVIPISHSQTLFKTMLAATSNNVSIQSRNIPDYAHIQRFNTNAKKPAQTVTLIETKFGGHNQLTEGGLDLVRLALKLPSHLAK
ncbi:AB hydrolase-1 domain-containing protein [Pseudozyma hubeiensis]|nr:AB hydrolase-1 domain-containing protein [Pseudozyma hubeiensis]